MNKIWAKCTKCINKIWAFVLKSGILIHPDTNFSTKFPLVSQCVRPCMLAKKQTTAGAATYLWTVPAGKRLTPLMRSDTSWVDQGALPDAPLSLLPPPCFWREASCSCFSRSISALSSDACHRATLLTPVTHFGIYNITEHAHT